MKFSFQPPDPSVSKQDALREALPSPIQFILLLTLCSEANNLQFLNVRVLFDHTVIPFKPPVSMAENMFVIPNTPDGYFWCDQSHTE